MPCHICVTCGAQFSDAPAPPQACPVCEDDRQYVGRNGQQWTCANTLKAEGHHNVLRTEEPGVIGIGIEPSFGIGQRALLIQTGEGSNILFDTVPLIDDPHFKGQIEDLGGIATIVISHPHFYGTMMDWAEAFGADIILPEADKEWVMRPESRYMQFWEGTTKQVHGATIIRLGGHFPGSCVLHWKGGAEGRGILCTGDTIQAVPDKGWVSFMYSYPNLIPLPASEVTRMCEVIESWNFEVLYGGWYGKVVSSHAKDVVLKSGERYVGFLEGSIKRRYF